MAKRFTDTEKWKKQFIKSLSTVNKLFFMYILDECDNAGVWHVEPEIASIRIGEEINIEEAKKQLGKHIFSFDDGEKWFIPYFIEFQYNQLTPTVAAHRSVIDKLNNYNLIPILDEYLNKNGTVKEVFKNSSKTVKDKDKAIVKDIDKEEDDVSVVSPGEPTLKEILEFGKQSGFDVLECKNFYNHYQSVDWYTAGHNPQKIIRWKPKLQQWMNKTDQFRGPTPNVEGKEQNKPYEYQIIRE